MSDGYHKPTEQEQAIIATLYAMATRVENTRVSVVGYAMGRRIIEDENGRWRMVFGKPVYEVGDGEFLGLIVEVPGVRRVADGG